MKKTLVAVAALVAVGAVSAQSTVSITGNFGAGYKSTNDGKRTATSSANGFEVTDGKIVVKASEDLGGGLKAGVSMDIQVRGRRGAASVTSPNVLTGVASNSVDGRDATIYVSGGFGTLTMGAVDHYNTLLDLAVPAQGMGLDNIAQFGGDGNVDLFSYTSPSMNGFTATVSILDSIEGPAAGGLQSTSTKASATELGLAYSAGPVNAGFEYTSFSKHASGTDTDSRWRLSGNYDFGPATVGAGFSKTSGTTTNVKETALGVSVPMGAMSFGLGYGKMVSTTASVDTTTSGWEAVANYSLSKRTNVQVAYRSEDRGVAANDRATAFRTKLVHSF